MPLITTTQHKSDLFIPSPDLDTFFDYEKFIENGIGKLSPDLFGTEIAIVGAGAAGLMAARLLHQIGFKPVIYEASGRIGGRLYSKHFTDDNGLSPTFAELGAMRFPISSKVLFKLTKEFELDTNIDFPDPGLVDTLLHYQNKGYLWKANQPVPELFGDIGENWNLMITPLIDKISKPWQAGNLKKVKEIWQNYIDHYKGTSFYQAIRSGSPVWTEDELNRFATLGIGTGGFGPLYHVGFTEILRIILHKREYKQKLIKEGVETFAHHLANSPVQTPFGNSAFGNEAIQLNTKVIDIYSGKNGNPVVVYSHKGQELEKEFKAVIVANTSRAMQFMGLSVNRTDSKPLLSAQVQRAIRNIHLINSSKLFIRTQNKFWKDKSLHLPETIQTDELPRGIYMIDYPQTENGVVCVSYTWGDDSSKLSGFEPMERFNLLKRTIQKIAPDVATHLIPLNNEIMHIDWQTEANYNGAFKLNLPGQEDDTAAMFYQYLSVNQKQTDSGVYLAGDSVSWAGGWVEGALQTAINAATAAAKRCGAEIPKESPLKLDPKLYHYE